MEREKENDNEMSYMYESDKKDKHRKTKKLQFTREERNELYTELVAEYVEDKQMYNIQQRKMKKIFFWIACLSFTLIVITSLVAVVIIAVNQKKTYTMQSLLLLD